MVRCEIESAADDRVIQFVRGEARERLMELAREESENAMETGEATHG